MSDSDIASSLLSTSDPAGSQPSLLDAPSMSEETDVDSLPSSEPDSDDVTVSDDYSDSDAEREWKESLQQLELLLTMVIVPYLGKYFGRKFAYWGTTSPYVKPQYRELTYCQGGSSSWNGSIRWKSW